MFGYFNKRTTNAYDFGVLFDTPLVFPISWDHSKIDGFTGRVNIVEHGGFSAFVVMAHTNAIFAGPGNGGLFVEPATGEFRIDHDQKFNSTVNLQQTFDTHARRLGRAQLAVRLGPGRRLGAGLRDRADASAAISRRRSACSAAAWWRRAIHRSRAARRRIAARSGWSFPPTAPKTT